MEIETQTTKENDINDLPDIIDGSKNRVSSSLRMKYEAEVKLIKHKWGSLEDIRNTLGLSQRKVCQLLLVDPSAWTRWTRKYEDGSEEEAPPHIYRSLSWYLLLLDKSPELSPYVFLQTVARPQIPEKEIQKLTGKITEELKVSLRLEAYEKLRQEVAYLKRTNKKQERYMRMLIGGFVTLISIWTLLYFS